MSPAAQAGQLGFQIDGSGDDGIDVKINKLSKQVARAAATHPYAPILLCTFAAFVFARTAQAHESGGAGDIFDDSHVLLSALRALLATTYARWGLELLVGAKKK